MAWRFRDSGLSAFLLLLGNGCSDSGSSEPHQAQSVTGGSNESVSGTGTVTTVGGAGSTVGSGGASAGGASSMNTSGGDGSGASTASTGGVASTTDGASQGGVGGSGAMGVGGSGATSVGGGATYDGPFMLGADISSLQESSASYVDTDGETKSIFALLKNHGFNYIRLRTFVDPSAAYGYASSANGCAGLSEAYGDRDHVVAYGQLVKEQGMGLLLDFHYSDVWADPGNQIIPEAWRGATAIEELADFVKNYTVDVVSTAVAAGARPDMVQVGNEITPGMLMHVPGANTNCWGDDPDVAPVGGSTSNWDNLATLLMAGIEGVREVDPTILVMLHIENTDDLAGVRWWVDSALSRGVEFDVLGLSCYPAFQGQPSVWENTFSALAGDYPDLSFVIAEYNPERTQANTVIRNLPGGRGLGTFFWEPTRSGEWGQAMFSWQGNSLVANSSDFQEYDMMLPTLGLD